MDAPDRRKPYSGRIVIYGIHEDGDHDRTVSLSTRSATNIHDDVRCMQAALELRDAIKRGVSISAEMFYKHVVGDDRRPYCLLLNNCQCARYAVEAPQLQRSCNNWRTS